MAVLQFFLHQMSGKNGVCCENRQFGWTECGYSKKLSSGDFYSQPCFNDPRPQCVLAMAMRSPWEPDRGAPGTSGPVHTPMRGHTVNLPEQI